MKEGLRWRLALTIVVTFLALVYAMPSFLPVNKSGLGEYLPSDKINLGLDLMGGIHLTLGVDVDKAVENSLVQMGQDIRSFARDEEISIMRPVVTTASGSELLQLVLNKSDDAAVVDKFEELLDKYDDNLSIEEREPLDEGRRRYTLAIRKEYRTYLADLAIDQAIKTIRNRIDQFGVTEPDIRKQQDYRIQVQLPGLKDPKRAIEIIGKTAHLEFKLVDGQTDPSKLAPGLEVLMMTRDLPDGSTQETPVVLQKNALLSGDFIADAKVAFDQYNQPYVAMTFNAAGARKFERITGENVGRQMAIVLDGKVHSAPVIQGRIPGGRASITGQFSLEEARDLSIVLRAGALPAPVNILEERSVGPSLGQESIDAGVMAAAIGFALVFGFMILYYGFAGLVADTVLVLNIVLIVAGLAGFGATLTLPGIAGIILTIGMAVDANVIIFERIREEIRKGLGVRAAVEEGYGRATLTILDANITTIIAAIILYQFGTGPVRGFAVTLSLGILASMFTAIFVSRILFDLWLGRKPNAKLSI